MEIEPITQIDIGGIHRVRIGDILNREVASEFCKKFQFAVAYMRLSGLDRLAASLDALLNRGGVVSGAIGIDDRITSIEALQSLNKLSATSTIFYTISGFIYHPKLYLMTGERQAVVVIGSANLTRDGLFRNVEIATRILLDFEQSIDYEVYKQYEHLINELLNTENPNIQPITLDVLDVLTRSNLIEHETQVIEASKQSNSFRKRERMSEEVEQLFPVLRVPTAPPGLGLVIHKEKRRAQTVPLVTPPATVGIVDTFIMQLSSFDSSHRTGRPGTPEVLIPLDAQNFFPKLSKTSDRKYPDANFEVILNTSVGNDRHTFRVWYYNLRSEFRLRMDHETVELSQEGGGDLLVINRLPEGNDPLYEVTVLPTTDPTYPAFLAFCQQISNGKRWGMGQL